MKIYEFVANSRSGHHSIFNWILLNKVGFQYDWKYKYTALGNSGLFHLSEANHDIPLGFRFLDESFQGVDTLFTAYEDTFWDYTIFSDDNVFKGPMSLRDYKKYQMDYKGRIVFLRNFYDNLASRIKANQKKMFGKWDDSGVHLFDVGQKYIERWKSQARACSEDKVKFLRFEDWLKNKKVREDFLLENFQLKDIFGIETVDGTPSSFGEKKKVLSRISEVEIPKETKKIIKEDGELHYLFGRLGYEFINL